MRSLPLKRKTPREKSSKRMRVKTTTALPVTSEPSSPMAKEGATDERGCQVDNLETEPTMSPSSSSSPGHMVIESEKIAPKTKLSGPAVEEKVEPSVGHDDSPKPKIIGLQRKNASHDQASVNIEVDPLVPDVNATDNSASLPKSESEIVDMADAQPPSNSSASVVNEEAVKPDSNASESKLPAENSNQMNKTKEGGEGEDKVAEKRKVHKNCLIFIMN